LHLADLAVVKAAYGLPMHDGGDTT
jgi:hypothetical protein